MFKLQYDARDLAQEFEIRLLSDGSIGNFVNDNLKKIGMDKSKVLEKVLAGGKNRNDAIFSVIYSIRAIEDEKERLETGVSLCGTVWESLFPEGSGSDAEF